MVFEIAELKIESEILQIPKIANFCKKKLNLYIPRRHIGFTILIHQFWAQICILLIKYELWYFHSNNNNTGLQGFVAEKLWAVSGVIFDVESESDHHVRNLRYLRLCARKMGFFANFGVMYGAHEFFFGFFLKCHHLALLFPFKMSYWTVTSDFLFHKDTAISSFDIYPNNLMSIHIDSLVHTILHSKICAYGFWWSVN